MDAVPALAVRRGTAAPAKRRGATAATATAATTATVAVAAVTATTTATSAASATCDAGNSGCYAPVTHALEYRSTFHLYSTAPNVSY